MRMMLNLFAGVLLLAITAPLVAHHSFAAEYDASKPVSVMGVVKKVEWQNPHIWFYLDVKDDSGKITTWGFSGGPPGMLQRRGITREVLKIGDLIKSRRVSRQRRLVQRVRRQCDFRGWPESIRRSGGRRSPQGLDL
jgi:hypothetical protein